MGDSVDKRAAAHNRAAHHTASGNTELPVDADKPGTAGIVADSSSKLPTAAGTGASATGPKVGDETTAASSGARRSEQTGDDKNVAEHLRTGNLPGSNTEPHTGAQHGHDTTKQPATATATAKPADVSNADSAVVSDADKHNQQRLVQSAPSAADGAVDLVDGSNASVDGSQLSAGGKLDNKGGVQPVQLSKQVGLQLADRSRSGE